MGKSSVSGLTKTASNTGIGGGSIVSVPNVSKDKIAELDNSSIPFVFTREYADLSNELNKYEYMDDRGKTVVVDADKAAAGYRQSAQSKRRCGRWQRELSIEQGDNL